MNSWKSTLRVGVRAAVEDVHHRHGQHVRRRRGPGRVERRQVRVERHAFGRRRRRAAAAIETPSSALAPRRLLVGVPSSAIIAVVERRAGRARLPTTRLRDLAVDVARPPCARLCRRSALLSPSRSSSASRSPVDAPDGTAARPNAPPSSVTSTSTVGLPRESRISRPCTLAIFIECLRVRIARLDARSRTESCSVCSTCVSVRHVLDAPSAASIGVRLGRERFLAERSDERLVVRRDDDDAASR